MRDSGPHWVARSATLLTHPNPAATQETTSPLRQRFLLRLEAIAIKPAARDYYVRWAESWTKARGHQSAERTQDYFDTLARETIPVAGASRLQSVPEASDSGDLQADLTALIDSLRRAVRLKNYAMATEEAYVHWSAASSASAISNSARLRRPPGAARSLPRQR